MQCTYFTNLAGLYELGEGGWVVNNCVHICSVLAQQSNDEHTLFALVCALSSCFISCAFLEPFMRSDRSIKIADAFVVINKLYVSSDDKCCCS